MPQGEFWSWRKFWALEWLSEGRNDWVGGKMGWALACRIDAMHIALGNLVR